MINRIGTRFVSVVLGISIVAAASLADAFTFSPIVSEFSPTGAGATRTYTVANKGTDKIPVQISAFTRQVDEDGKETLTPTDHFKIFPDQFVVPPQQSRAVRITYRGPGTLTAESAYRFVAEQLPVEIQKPVDGPPDAGKIKFLIRYEGSVYVVPARAKPDLKAEASLVSNSEKSRELELIVRNDGTAHQLLNGARVKLTASSVGAGAPAKPVSITLEGADLQKVFDKQNLLAGSRRRFKIPWPEKLPAGPVTASIELP